MTRTENKKAVELVEKIIRLQMELNLAIRRFINLTGYGTSFEITK